jgi:replicative DNA helicase
MPCHKVGISLALEQMKLKKIKAKKHDKAANKVEFVTERSKPKNDTGINLNIVNLNSPLHGFDPSALAPWQGRPNVPATL